MNLALHGFLLQVVLSIFNFQYGYQLCSAGEPGYLDFDNLPETNFSCQGKVIGGYYADVEAGCQMFHVCTIGQKDEIMDIKFLCLNGTVFDQETRVCERVDEVDCSKSERFYNLNLELYGNNAVTLSLHEGEDEVDESPILIEDHQGTTSTRPSTTTTTTTQRPVVISSTTAASGPYQHPNGYPQHYQPQPPFPSIQTSQSKSLYDDKNGAYHRQYIYHIENNNEQNNANQDDNRATSYQIFSNQGQSSTTGAPQIHQIHYSSTLNPSTVSPIFHATSSTIQSLLSANNPTLINPIFHNNGISSTTEHYNVHSNAPRDTTIYQQNHNADDETHRHTDNHQENRQFLTPIQATSQGKISKLTISPIPGQHEIERTKQQLKDDMPTISQSHQTSEPQQQQQQQHRIAGNFLTIASTGNGSPTVGSFYSTPKAPSKSQSSTTTHITQHIHIIPPFTIPQLKPHQVTINLPPPDIQRIVQNPSPLLPTQSRVIVTAKASVSDESGRPLNTTQLVTLPLPTVPASYDDYKEGDESFDPFYRDVPKIRNIRRSYIDGLAYFRELRKKRSIRNKRNIDEKMNESIERIVDSEVSHEEIALSTDKDESTASDYTSDEDYIGSYEAPTRSPHDEVEYDSGVEVTEKETIDDNITEVYFDDQLNDDISSVELSLMDKGEDYENASGELKHNHDDNDDDYINYDDYTESSTEINNSTEQESNMQSINNESIPVLIDTNNVNNKSLEVGSENVTTVNPLTLQIPIAALSENITDNYHVANSDEVVTEGILIFTDEIPRTEVNDESRGNENAGNDDEEKVGTMSTGSISFDYVDDNYEPENYHEEKSIESPIDRVTTEKTIELHRQMNESVADLKNTTTSTIPDTTPATTSTFINSTTPNAITSTTILTTPITTTLSLSSSTVTSTENPRTKPTTIKLFKSMITRKNYVYIPPSTTSVPVKIKSRPSLYNPKPAKPPKSYNELAPKPVIRKIVLNARRIPTATAIRNSLNDISEVTTRETLPLDNQIPDTTQVIEHSAMTRNSDTVVKEVTANIVNVLVENAMVDQMEIVGSKQTTTINTSTEKKVADLIIVTPETPHSTTNVFDNFGIGSSTLASVQPTYRKSISIHKRNNAFICPRNLDSKRFYADKRDCRLFHYCSYGYSSHQLLDFRFVCEEGTIFDEKTQSCIHHHDNSRCLKRIW